MRICSSCRVEKSDSDFYVSGKYLCKECTRKKVAAYRKAHPEKVAVWGKRYADKNKEAIAAKGAKYRKDFPERRKAAKERWRKANLARYAAYFKKWSAANPTKRAASIAQWSRRNAAALNAKKAARMAAKKGATPKWANKFFIDEIYDLARRRTECLSGGVEWSVDHIVPLKSDVVCGLHVEHNLRVIPHLDNVSKKNRWWPGMWGIDAG